MLDRTRNTYLEGPPLEFKPTGKERQTMLARRDEYAKAALTGIVMNCNCYLNCPSEWIAREAWNISEAMEAEREWRLKNGT